MRIDDKQKKQIDLIENIVCNMIGAKPQQVINKDRSRTPTLARGMIWYILHVDYGYSGSIISDIYIRKDRTVWQQISETKYKINNYRLYADFYNKIKESLASNV